MVKKSLRTILLVVAVNVILFLAHMIAVFGWAFNDSGAEFVSVIHLLPNLVFCIGPLAVGSVFLIRFFAKKVEFYKPVLYVVQGLLVACYIVVYIHSYVPTSMIRMFADSVAESKAEKKQRKMDEEALGYLGGSNVVLYDEIENGKESIAIYICHDSDKVVFRYCNEAGERTCYCVADANYIEGEEPDSIVKYRDLDNGNRILLVTIDHVYLEVGENRYLCLDRQQIDVYCDEYIHVCFLYLELINRDIIENNFRYLPNDVIALEIEENERVCSITEESLRCLPVTNEEEIFAYGWTILRDGREVLRRRIRTGEYTLNLKELPEGIWKQDGSYEIYLHTHFYSDLPGTEYSGDIKASNSVTWEVLE